MSHKSSRNALSGQCRVKASWRRVACAKSISQSSIYNLPVSIAASKSFAPNENAVKISRIVSSEQQMPDLFHLIIFPPRGIQLWTIVSFTKESQLILIWFLFFLWIIFHDISNKNYAVLGPHTHWFQSGFFKVFLKQAKEFCDIFNTRRELEELIRGILTTIYAKKSESAISGCRICTEFAVGNYKVFHNFKHYLLCSYSIQLKIACYLFFCFQSISASRFASSFSSYTHMCSA